MSRRRRRAVICPSKAGAWNTKWSRTYPPAEYLQRMLDGWRHFGGMLFRPRCPACTQCRALRVDVNRFEPNRSQRRAWERNRSEVAVFIGRPTVTQAKLKLYDRYHEFQTHAKGWPEHPPKDADSYADSFVHNPPFTEEWTYFLGRPAGRRAGYVDRLPMPYRRFTFYDPEELCRAWAPLTCCAF